MSDSIVPGSDVSYQTCKTIYLYHPLGAKIAEQPCKAAQSQDRKITITDGPEDRIRDAFKAEWSKLRCDQHILNVASLARVYGIASIAIGESDKDVSSAIDYFDLAKAKIYFNVFDPLNTAGSLVLTQDPNSSDFQKVNDITVNGVTYHRSRCMAVLNEFPIYIAYTSSAFGYVGRSSYQRTLFPLKSFINTMIADDLVAVKAGVIIAKMKAQGSVIDNRMAAMLGFKRNIVKEATTGNVISITPEESIESLNLQNLEGPLSASRKNIIENIASGTPMPAKLLLQESFAAGFSDGAEDAKHIAEYVRTYRNDLEPIYSFMDRIVQHRAWNEDFFKAIQKEFPDDYSKKDYKQAFFQWQNSFKAEWPSLLEEPDSEKANVDDVKLKAAISAVEVLLPNLDPEGKAKAIQWLCDCLNDNEVLFSNPLELDMDALIDHLTEMADQEKEQQQSGTPEGSPGQAKEAPEAKPAATPKPPKPEGLGTRQDGAKRRVSGVASFLGVQ